MNLHPKYIDLSLKRLEVLLKKLENHHYNLPKTVHIAGTNGKGSTLSYLRNILTLNGYSCHAYISPQPGFYFGEKDGRGLADPIKKGHGRIFYGHSELGSRMNYRNALAEGGRAGEQAAGIL